MGELDGKVAVITGAGFGMGRASAQVFVAHGARVVCAPPCKGEGAADGVPCADPPVGAAAAVVLGLGMGVGCAFGMLQTCGDWLALAMPPALLCCHGSR